MIQTREDLMTNMQSCTQFIEKERQKKVNHIKVNPKLWIFPRAEKDTATVIQEFNRLNNIFNKRVFRDDNLS